MRNVLDRFVFEVDEMRRNKNKEENECDHDVVVQAAPLIRPQNVPSDCAPDLFSITPPTLVPLQADVPITSSALTDRAATFIGEAPQSNAALQSTQIQPAGEAPPVNTGPAQDWRPHGVAQAPPAGDLPQSAKWSVSVPAGALDGLSELFLEVNYEGDLARLSANHKLLDDDFYNGEPWMVGLSRFLARDGSGKFELSILPLRKDPPVYFEFPQPLQFGPDGQIDKLNSIRLVPEYQLVITTSHE